MTGSTIGMFVIMIIYLAFMVVIGILFSKKNNDVEDFYLGGRKLGPIVTAMSAEASDMSSWLLMGLPGVAYLSGLSEAGWTAIGLAIGTYLNWLIVARRLRRYSEKIDAITIPDFFSKRFKEKTPVILGISALMIVIFFVPYTASGFAACGKLFSTLFGINYMTAMIVSAVIIVTYTALGGFLAASTTDLIQSIVMTIALISVVFFGISQVGGINVVIDNAKGLAGYLSFVQSHNVDGTTSPYGALTIASTLAWGLGYFGMPHILLRFMGIHDDSKLKLSRRIASVWVVIAMGVAIFIGVIGYSMSKVGVISDTFTASGEAETLLIRTAQVMADMNPILLVIGGLILAGILACTMSTADSQLLAASSSISQNIIQDVCGIKVSKKGSMIMARVSVIIIAIIAMFLAMDQNSSVFRIVSFAWAGFGATFGPIMLFSLFWKKTTRGGALAGMISGAAMVFIWKFAIAKLGGLFAIYELLPAFVISCLFIVVVSLITKAPDDETVKEFDAINEMK